MVLYRIGGPFVEFIRFSLRVLWYEVPNHQYKCYGVVLDDFHVDFLGYMERRSCKKRIANKSGKKKQFWANSRSGTGIETERYRYRPSEANRYWYRSK